MPRITGQTNHDGVQAVSLSLQILERLAQHSNGVGVTALADSFGTSKSRVHRHLQTLVAQGYVVQLETSEKYTIGARLIMLGRRIAEAFDLAQISRGVMIGLREALGYSVVISQLDTEGNRVLATMAGKSAIEINVKPGSILPFHCSSQGKISLAFAEPELCERVLASPLTKMTSYTNTNVEALRKEIDEIRLRGWAVAPNEALIGVNTLAAPIRDGAGTLVGSLGIVDSVQHIAEIPRDEQIEALTSAAVEISRLLGYRLEATQ